MIKIVTDSSADLPKELLEKYGITVVPLTISVGGKDYAEGVDIQPAEFFWKMYASEELPKTSQPAPGAFAKSFSSFAEEDEVLCLTISSGLSGTYQAANLAKDLTNANVTVVDTLAGSLGHGLQTIRVAEMVQAGMSMDEILQRIEVMKENTHIFVFLSTLENIVKGGRLSRFQGSVAKILNLKIILDRADGGVVKVVEKIRGKKKAYEKLISLMKEVNADFSNVTFGITHTGNLEEVEVIKQKIIDEFNPKDVLVNYMGATMGTYAGKDGMIVTFL